MRSRAVFLFALGLAGLYGWAQEAGMTPQERLKRDDRNGDGRVTREEFGGRPELFGRLDRNGDGAITPDEVPARAAGRVAQAPPIPEGLTLHRDVVYGRGGQTPLRMDILAPAQKPATPLPALVFIHGGAWRGGDKSGGLRQLMPFAQRGYVCATIAYRLSQEAVFPAQIEDCKCAIRFLRAHAGTYGLDPQRIGVWGSSAGGHLVALLGVAGDAKDLEGSGGWPEQSSRVQAVCDWFGPSDLAAMLDQPSKMNHRAANAPESLLIGGAVAENPDKARRASPMTYVTSDDAPFLIMHGTEDPVVPFGQSELLAAALRKAGVAVEFVPVEGEGHGGPKFSTPENQQRIAGFFDRHLRGVK